MSEGFLNGRVTLHAGDCREVIRGLADASIDSIVTDPPYALVSIGKRFGKPGAAAAQAGASGAYARASAGFMGQQWDTGETAFAVEFWAEALRVLKPGGHVIAFSGTRSYHRLACAIEDAGFEIRDQLAWVYGSGFPKSHDVAKGLDKAAGIWRGRAKGAKGANVAMAGANYERSDKGDPVTPEAQAWQGWGTALKPAWEPIVLARKPIEGTVAANVLAHGAGALNIDGCRVGTATVKFERAPGNVSREHYRKGTTVGPKIPVDHGRWPANILHDGSDEVVAAFPGESSRFFYSAKADAQDRIGSKHPTVKPVDLMQWLCRLVTPPGGTVLDPFAGSGTTGEAAWREGFSAVLIEREATYREDIARRVTLALAGPATRKAEIARRRPVAPKADAGLFAGLDEPAEGGGDGSSASSPIRPDDRASRVEAVSA